MVLDPLVLLRGWYGVTRGIGVDGVKFCATPLVLSDWDGSKAIVLRKVLLLLRFLNSSALSAILWAWCMLYTGCSPI